MPPRKSTSVVLGFVILQLAFRQEGKQWVGECVELGTSTFASSLPRAHKELIELVELDLSTLEQTGERERFFEEHGIKFYSEAVVPEEVEQTLKVGQETFVDVHSFPIPAAA